MSTITIDGLNEEEFRRSIERRLRQNQTAEAIDRLRDLIAPYAGAGAILPERFLTVQARDLVINGWDSLGEAIRRHDRPGRPITALQIAFAWPGEEMPQPDADGRLNPVVEVGYYNDDSFPFSQSAREDLLDGYSYHGCTWADDCEASERSLWLGGIDDLHGALALLEMRLLASEDPDDDEICAGSLGACLLSVLLHQAVADRIASDGLPRPVCVLAGSNGVYPYFDAPVAGMPADVLKANEDEDAAHDAGVPGPRYSSLLVAGIPRAQKRAVLVLEESAEESAVRIATLRGTDPADITVVAPQEQPEEITIAASAASPLMTKKPHDKPVGGAWDFRDMLTPRDADYDPGDGPRVPSIDEWDDWGDEEPEETGGTTSNDHAGSDWPRAVPDPIEPELPRPAFEPAAFDESHEDAFEAAPREIEERASEEPVEAAEPVPLELVAPEAEEPVALADEQPAARVASGSGFGAASYSATQNARPGFSLFDRALEGPLAPPVSDDARDRSVPPSFEARPSWDEDLVPFDVAGEIAEAAQSEPSSPQPSLLADEPVDEDLLELVEPMPPAWPLGLAWLELAQAETDRITAASPAGADPAKGDVFSLWARLRAWLRLSR